MQVAMSPPTPRLTLLAAPPQKGGGHTQAAYAAYLDGFAAATASVDDSQVEAACDAIEAAYRAGRRVFVCGNGGSAATASHFSEDLAKLMWRPELGARLRVMALTDAVACITALANDDGYARIFEIQLAMQAEAGDLLVAISGSGRSPNVLAAADWARAQHMAVVSVTGYDGGHLRRPGEPCVHVASDNMGLLEGVHMLVLDFISKEVRHRAYGIPHAAR